MQWSDILFTIEHNIHIVECGKIYSFKKLDKFEFGSNTSQKSWEGCHKRLEKKVALKRISYGNILQLMVSKVSIMFGYNAQGKGRVSQK